MATLRSLLPGSSSDTSSTVAFPARSLATTSPVWRQTPGSQLVFGGLCAITQDTNTCRNMLCCWKVPAGVTTLVFELWGAGGSGGGVCCCMFGFPGGSGAYAKKTVTGTLGGCEYVLFAGYAGCCSPVNCGYRGCQSYVTGYGLTNFCAEGGHPGCSFCNAWVCTCSSCGFSWAVTACTQCACYYGADYGCFGTYGYIQTDCCSGDPFCWFKMIHPHPSNQLSQGVTYSVTRYEATNNIPSTQSCKNGQGGMTGGANAKPIGAGAGSAAAQSGNCYCGAPGGPGLIKVTYY